MSTDTKETCNLIWCGGSAHPQGIWAKSGGILGCYCFGVSLLLACSKQRQGCCYILQCAGKIPPLPHLKRGKQWRKPWQSDIIRVVMVRELRLADVWGEYNVKTEERATQIDFHPKDSFYTLFSFPYTVNNSSGLSKSVTEFLPTI